jgi:hypothetical protein
MCVSHFTRFFSVSCHISRPTMWVSPFPLLSVFSPYSRSTNVCVSFNKFFGVSCHISCPTMSVSPFPRSQCSRHIPGPTVCNFHFSIFSVFLAIFQFIQCLCLNFHVFKFSQQNPRYTVCIAQYFTYSTVSCHISVSTVCVSHFAHFSVFLPQSSSYTVCFSYLKFFTVSYLPYSMSYSVILISHTFQCFSPYFLSYYVSFSISSFVSFLAIFQVLQPVSVCLILHVFPFPSHNPGPTVYISHLLRFSVFVSIFQVIQYLCLIFQFLPFSR